MCGLLHANFVDNLLQKCDHFLNQFSYFFITETHRVSHDKIEWHENDIDLLRIKVEASFEELGQNLDVYVAFRNLLLRNQACDKRLCQR